MDSSRYKRYPTPEAVPTRKFIQHPTKQDVFLPVHRRPMRMLGVDYTSKNIVFFVTFNTDRLCEVLLTDENGQCVWDAILDEIARIGCHIYAVCMMPDHIHLLLSPSGKGESLSDIIRRIKTRACTILRQQMNLYLRWQTSFHDHVLRSSEREDDEFQAIVNYIYTNPDRAGLGDDYPFRCTNIP